MGCFLNHFWINGIIGLRLSGAEPRMKSRSIMLFCAALPLFSLLGACGTCPPPPDGSRADVKTGAGSYDGYIVRTDCERSDGGTLGLNVVGTGTRWAGDVPPDETGFTEEREAALEALAAEVISATSVRVGVFFSEGCVNRGGLSILPDHFTQIDNVIEAVGALLKQGDLREEVTIRYPVTTMCD